MRIYLASSWRNTFQRDVLLALRGAGHQVYDFRNPHPGNDGFKWHECDPEWQGWDAERFREMLAHPVAERSFDLDMAALIECDACVLLLPSGRSAHIEAGYAKGNGKELHILLLGENEPELMYRMADSISVSIEELVSQVYRDTTYAYTVPAFACQCRECGCWDGHACPDGCHWVEEDLCSACVKEAPNAQA